METGNRHVVRPVLGCTELVNPFDNWQSHIRKISWPQDVGNFISLSVELSHIPNVRIICSEQEDQRVLCSINGPRRPACFYPQVRPSAAQRRMMLDGDEWRISAILHVHPGYVNGCVRTVRIHVAVSEFLVSRTSGIFRLNEITFKHLKSTSYTAHHELQHPISVHIQEGGRSMWTQLGHVSDERRGESEYRLTFASHVLIKLQLPVRTPKHHIEQSI
mmetsp:Transcript_40432/g.94979  ORF Transcript_40432/g.94979 Transcript_40432/m.94979 type:complete len:218 (-) Transcript_40432:499-1152(-)